jgi:hypothetical protein
MGLDGGVRDNDRLGAGGPTIQLTCKKSPADRNPHSRSPLRPPLEARGYRHGQPDEPGDLVSYDRHHHHGVVRHQPCARLHQRHSLAPPLSQLWATR